MEYMSGYCSLCTPYSYARAVDESAKLHRMAHLRRTQIAKFAVYLEASAPAAREPVAREPGLRLHIHFVFEDRPVTSDLRIKHKERRRLAMGEMLEERVT